MDTILSNNRQIRIFISSTFCDMQEERDYLFYYVFPKIRKIAEERDVRVVEIDLRWGITYEESENGKVLEICFKEIDKCRPYFIGILGDRYGWCPEITELQKNPDAELSFPWIKEYIVQGKSVTEMEMQFGALCKALQPHQEIHASFYIKEDSKETSQEQKLLKQLVRDHTEFPNYAYSTAREFGEKVEKNLIALLDELYPEHECTPYEKEKNTQRAALHTFAYGVSPKPTIINKLNYFIHSSQRYLIIHGPDGCGKTSTLAYWISQLSETHHIAYYFVGVSNVSTMESYIYYIRDRLRDMFDINDSTSEEEERFKNLTYNITLKRPVIFVIDGVDMFDDAEIHPFEFLPNVAAGSKVIISARTSNHNNTCCTSIGSDLFDTVAREHPEIYSDYKYYRDVISGKKKGPADFEEYKEKKIRLDYLAKKDRKEIITKTLNDYGKKLTGLQLQKIVADNKTENPFILRNLINSIINLRNPEDLDAHIWDFCQAKNEKEFYIYLISRVERIYGKDLTRDFLLSISVSRKGIPEEDLRMILKIKQTEFSLIYYGVGLIIKNISGYIKLANDYIKDCIIDYYKDVSLNFYRQKYINYYLGRDADTEIKPNMDSWMWKFDLPYQCKFLMQLDDLYYVVSQPQVLLAQFSGAYSGTAPQYYTGEITEYWSLLLGQTEKYSLDVYFDSPERYINYEPLSLAYVVQISRCLQETKNIIHYAKRALEIYSLYGDTYIPTTLSLCISLSNIYKAEGNDTERRIVLRKAFDICKKYVKRANLSTFLRTIILDLVEIYGDITQNDDLSITFNEHTKEGEIFYEEVYDLLQSMSSLETYIKEAYINIYRSVVSALAHIYSQEKKYEMALHMRLEALKISEKYKNTIVGGYYLLEANCAYDHYDCATIYQLLGNTKEAIVHCEKAIEYYNREQNELIVGNMRIILKEMLLKLQSNEDS